jgi:hypothetical protein
MTAYVNPYTNPAHREWIASGHCDSISEGKVWCGLRAGHAGSHMAQNQYPGPPPYTAVRWTREHDRNQGVPVTRP